MAYEEIVQSITIESSGNLSAGQYRFVVVNGSGQIAAPSAGVRAVGVLQSKPAAAGDAATVAVAGVSKVEAAATLAAGAKVACDATGKAAAGTTGHHYVGVALAGGDAGELIPVLLQYGGTAA